MQSLLAPTRLCPSKSFLALQAKGNTHSGSDIGYHGNSADSSSLLGEWSSLFAPFPDPWDTPHRTKTPVLVGFIYCLSGI